MGFNEYADPISPNFLRYDGMTVVQALNKFDPSLAVVGGRSSSFLYNRKYNVKEGQIGLATYRDRDQVRSRIFGPGSYLRIGLKWRWNGTRDIEKENRIFHNDLTIFTVPTDMVTVIRVGENQHRLRKGRYIIREPIKIERDYYESGRDSSHSHSINNGMVGSQSSSQGSSVLGSTRASVAHVASVASVARPNINASVSFIVEHIAEFEQKDPSDKCYADLRKGGLFAAIEYLRQSEHYELIEKWQQEGFYWPF
jgi:hypothetical protein